MTSKSPFSLSLFLLGLLLTLTSATSTSDTASTPAILNPMPPITETSLAITGTSTLVSTTLTYTSILEATGTPGAGMMMGDTTAAGSSTPTGEETLGVDGTGTGPASSSPSSSPSPSANASVRSKEGRVGWGVVLVGLAGLAVGAMGC